MTSLLYLFLFLSGNPGAILGSDWAMSRERGSMYLLVPTRVRTVLYPAKRPKKPAKIGCPQSTAYRLPGRL